MLKIEDLEVSYGAVQALRGISMEVNDGEIVSLIGPTAPARPPRCTPSPASCPSRAAP